jgi:predicted transcriptional regulator
MDDPVFIDFDEAVENVVEKVKGNEDTLIVKKDGSTVGEIHEHSLLKVLVPEDRLDEEKVIGILGFSFDQSYVAKKAGDLMNKHEIRVEPDESVEEIAFLMDREDVRAIPVEEDGEIIGVVHENRVVEEI